MAPSGGATGTSPTSPAACGTRSMKTRAVGRPTRTQVWASRPPPAACRKDAAGARTNSPSGSCAQTNTRSPAIASASAGGTSRSGVHDPARNAPASPTSMAQPGAAFAGAPPPATTATSARAA